MYKHIFASVYKFVCLLMQTGVNYTSFFIPCIWCVLYIIYTYRKRRKLYVDFVKEENCAWILFMLYAQVVVYRTIKISTLAFICTQKSTKKIHITSIVGVSSIKPHNKTTAHNFLLLRWPTLQVWIQECHMEREEGVLDHTHSHTHIN